MGQRPGITGFRGSLAWYMGRGRPRPGRYLRVSEALGELCREEALRAACGGGLPGGELPSANTVPNSPEIKQVTRARSVCLPSLQDSRSRAVTGSRFLLGHSTSSSASRQYWKLVAAIGHPGNIFILLDIEEWMSPSFLKKKKNPMFAHPHSQMLYFFKTSILKHQYIEISSCHSWMLL